jgi:hypothetical protein
MAKIESIENTVASLKEEVNSSSKKNEKRIVSVKINEVEVIFLFILFLKLKFQMIPKLFF